MVYRWTDCPALTGLDLGTYTGLTMVDDLQGENQDIMKNTYIGRRAYYTDKTALESETYDALWEHLDRGCCFHRGARDALPPGKKPAPHAGNPHHRIFTPHAKL